MLGYVSQTLVAPTDEHALLLSETLSKAGLVVTTHPKRPLQLIVTCQPQHLDIVQTVALRLDCTIKGRVSGAIRLSWPPLEASPNLVALLGRLRKQPPVFSGTGWTNAEVCAYELAAGVTLPRDLVELLYKFGEFSLSRLSIDLGLQHDARLRALLPAGSLVFGNDTSGFVYAVDLANALGIGRDAVIALAPDSTRVDDAHVVADSVAATLLSALDGVDPRALPTVATVRSLKSP